VIWKGESRKVSSKASSLGVKVASLVGTSKSFLLLLLSLIKYTYTYFKISSRLCSRSFKVILQRLESDLINGIPISSILQDSRELASLKTVYTMTGFPLNTTFTDIKAILSLVNNTDVHSNSDKGIEFAVAVSCTGYPGRFISVWIYVASLTKTF
jgi:hypothetical protein